MSNQFRSFRFAAAALSFAGAALIATQASANPFALFAPLMQPMPQQQVAPQIVEPAIAPEADESNFELPARFKRQVVDYRTNEAPGTVIVDTPNTYLYLVMGNGKAMRYGIGVGREGFTWTGVKAIDRKAEWPDWHPPAEMLQRQPYLPRFMAGGPGNPLGARAMYLGGTVYRIHGTIQPSTIGSQVSSGCIRLTNADVSDLYERVKVGARVVVMPMHGGARAQIEPRQTQSVAIAQPASPSFIRANGIY
jgi:lipoprotein-anchoring transpeptidase ErfK/SrfK